MLTQTFERGMPSNGEVLGLQHLPALGRQVEGVHLVQQNRYTSQSRPALPYTCIEKIMNQRIYVQYPLLLKLPPYI
jgi:hypothetical protein